MSTFAAALCIGSGIAFVLFLLPHIGTYIYLRKNRKGETK